MTISRIALGLTGQGSQHQPIAKALELAGALGASLTLLHARDPHAGSARLAFVDYGPDLSPTMLAAYVEKEYGQELPDANGHNEGAITAPLDYNTCANRPLAFATKHHAMRHERSRPSSRILNRNHYRALEDLSGARRR